MSIADLHTHSTASDGQYAPARLVELAKERGIQVLALTDHDSVDGVEEAGQAGERLGVTVVRGIELGALEYRNLHILGYNFAPEAPALASLCQKLRTGREERVARLLDFLEEKGVPVAEEEVRRIAGGGAIGRPHFARVMVEKGYVQSNREAFDRYLDTEEYQRIAPWKATARQCLEAIKAAGGKASLAHPYQLGLGDGPLRELVAQLKGWGLEGIECYYPVHTPRQQAFYLELARRYGLHPTGGSDFHGEKVKPDIQLAALDLNTDWIFV
ncbi:PHP domain-containing protein [Acutalibacter intestini]|uniref:PHP domain-containing protein n=1 Tax=Acutalibacter intestini TaxID=3093659 RepID=UPI002AC9498F|nr:PHP domain-containing protein [Acutalibacter sp. M00204]